MRAFSSDANASPSPWPPRLASPLSDHLLGVDNYGLITRTCSPRRVFNTYGMPVSLKRRACILNDFKGLSGVYRNLQVIRLDSLANLEFADHCMVLGLFIGPEAPRSSQSGRFVSLDVSQVATPSHADGN